MYDMKKLFTLLMLLATGAATSMATAMNDSTQVFCGAVGTEGCKAVSCEDALVVGWAGQCRVERGWWTVADTTRGRVTYGVDSLGNGPASLTDNLNVVSLGDGGRATLVFNPPIANHEGSDFAVYENSFDDAFLELAFVEVSSDGEHFVRFPAYSNTQTTTQIGSIGKVDPTRIHNLAGKYRMGWGTPFDLSDLADSTGIDLNHITHIRIVDAVGSINPLYATYDCQGHMVNDPWPTVSYSSGFDLAGVAVLAPNAAIGEVKEVDIRVAPNPASNRITVRAEGLEDADVQLFDLAARRIRHTTLRHGAAQLEVSTLPAGIYILRVGRHTQSVCIAR